MSLKKPVAAAALAAVLGGLCGVELITAQGTGRVRARDLGITIGIYPTGANNAITDVDGVLVGHTTIIRGEGALKVGEGPVRTGVTAILPRKDIWENAVFGATFTLNGDGEMTGTHWIKDLGTLAHPVLITNTGSVGAVDDAAVAYMAEKHPTRRGGMLPVVAETADGRLNDIRGRHVQQTHVYAALDGAHGGAVAEGNVGGGTGMVCYGFKGGIGTSSRKLPQGEGGYTVGVLVQANHGLRDQLVVDGVPVGREIPVAVAPLGGNEEQPADHEGSIIIVIATDAPLSSGQLERLARRASLGLARTGSSSANGSGDIFVAFSTANTVPMTADAARSPTFPVTMLMNDNLNPLFRAVVEATEESIINALTAAETMTGINGNKVEALPYGPLAVAMRKYGRPLSR